MAILFPVLILPLQLLNSLGFIVAAIWLGIAGEWATIALSVLAGFLAEKLLPFALLPQIAIGLPAVWLTEKGYRIPVIILQALSQVYLQAVICAWVAAVLWYFGLRMTNPDLMAPMLLIAYTVAVYPWTLAAHAQGNDAYAMQGKVTVVFLQAGMAIVVGMIYFGDAHADSLVLAFGSVVALSMVVQFWLARKINKEDASP